MRAALIALAAGLALGAGGAWWAQGQRYGLKLEELKHATTNKELIGTRQAVTDMAGFQKGFNDALQQFQSTQQGNAQAQQDLGRVLLDLRGVTAGLRGDFAGLPERIAAASAPALSEYAATCTAVFETMAAGGGRLAEAGAGIARQAEGHAVDVGMMLEVWPGKDF